ncbi:MAG: CoA pyrophosphatase [Rhizobiales bacterium]|nr:CoA pyrophosphatase [Hyphomicrobiales bacterium]MBA68856.1 CoA pyrophosphatase [Hyphomicrobiales bacterium]|tara:strand:- start:87 stop:737 length:651 start_codon:yes stop_codon:yes gene_type:complete
MVGALQRFDATDFRTRAARHRPEDEVTGPGPTYLAHGDHALNADMVLGIDQATLRDAAVLIPVIDEGEDARVILTQRTATLRKHSGQIAFPGGAVDPGDGSVDFAAKREAQEEIGLDPGLVEVVGHLPDYLTMTGFRITPVLAVVKPGFDLVPNPAEVDAIFEVPLGFLMDPANHRQESRVWEGRERHYFVMPYGERYIWGVTAGIIRVLYERLYS